MNKKTLIAGSAVAIGLSGLLWRLIEDEILALKSRAIINETASIRTQEPKDKAKYTAISERLKRRANLYEIVQLAIPWTHVYSLRKLYDKYMAKDYLKTAKSSLGL